MVTTLQQPVTHRRSELAVIDCDIHPALKSPKALHPYLSERWRQYRDTIGDRGFGGSYYPRGNLERRRRLGLPIPQEIEKKGGSPTNKERRRRKRTLNLRDDLADTRLTASPLGTESMRWRGSECECYDSLC